MNLRVITIEDKKYVECMASDSMPVAEKNILDVVAVCMENETRMLMFDSGALSEDFFKLSTGVAGAILQKLVNYQIKTAAVIDHDLANSGRFREFALESNKGSHFRIFNTKEEAESWLISIK